MPSAVEIASNALLRIGAEPITSLDPPDDTVEAKTVAQHFNPTRDALLRKHPWNFAIKRDSIAADVTAPAWGLAYAYTLPNDWIRILEVNGQSRDLYKWRIESSKLVTDLTSPIEIRYVARIEDAEAWDPLFVEAFETKLAMRIAEKITGLTTLTNEMMILHREAINDARSMDGFEQTDETTDDTNDHTWLLARMGGSTVP